MGNDDSKIRKIHPADQPTLDNLVTCNFEIAYHELKRLATLVDFFSSLFRSIVALEADKRLVLLLDWHGDSLVGKKVSGIHEIETLIKLKNHSRIVRFFGFCRVPAATSDANTHSSSTEVAYTRQKLILLQFHSEGDLEKYIQTHNRQSQNGLSFAAKIQLLLDVCHGLFHIHQFGFIYRDLAMRNILLDYESKRMSGDDERRSHVLRASITDFGWSLELPLLDNDTKTRASVIEVRMDHAPWRIMAPECVSQSLARFSVFSDIWSFGVLVYSLIEEKRPFNDIQSIEKVKEVISGYQEDKPNLTLISHELYEGVERDCYLELNKQVLQNCLKVDPESRIDLASIIVILEGLLSKLLG